MTFKRGFMTYIIVAFLVFGYHYNRPPTCDTQITFNCDGQRFLSALIIAQAWPVYFLGELAIYVTKPREMK